MATMGTNNTTIDGEFSLSDSAEIASNADQFDSNASDGEYDGFVDTLADGKYGGELWAEAEREKIRAQAEVRLSSKRNNDSRLQSATERLRRAVDDQKAIEEEFPAAAKWGKYYISVEAVNARQAENNTP